MSDNIKEVCNNFIIGATIVGVVFIFYLTGVDRRHLNFEKERFNAECQSTERSVEQTGGEAG